MPRPAHDLAGRRFGRLVAIEKATVRGRTCWRCVCDCGATSYPTATNLLRGMSASCGCARPKTYQRRPVDPAEAAKCSTARGPDLAGRRFGRLVAIERSRVEHGGKKRFAWRCVCDCGESVVVFAQNLRTGNTTSCGCLRRELATAMGVERRWRRFCRQCGAEFDAASRQSYCSTACLNRARWPHLYTHCPTCGVRFRTTSGQVYCDRRCRRVADNRRRVEAAHGSLASQLHDIERSLHERDGTSPGPEHGAD